MRVGKPVGLGGRDGMKRLGIAVLGSLSFTLVSAASAFAQSDIPPNVAGEVVQPAGEVVQPPGAAPGTTAFTGTDITVWMVVAAAMLLLGIGLLLAARRRARGAQIT
jgi:LPXTG-motif cell wall-anchored protein